jgi:hypothetical protein
MTGLNCALLSAYVWLTVTETGIETIESEKS